jgi:hypothetical protein
MASREFLYFTERKRAQANADRVIVRLNYRLPHEAKKKYHDKRKVGVPNTDEAIQQAEDELVKEVLEGSQKLQALLPDIHKATRKSREGIQLSAASLVDGALSRKLKTRTSVHARDTADDSQPESIDFKGIVVPLEAVKEVLQGDEVLLGKLGLVLATTAAVALVLLENVKALWQVVAAPSWLKTQVVRRARWAISVAIVPLQWSTVCTRDSFLLVTGMRDHHADESQKRRRRIMEDGRHQTPVVAIEAGNFFYEEDKERSDKTPSDLIRLIKIHAHHEEVAQALGDKDRLKKESRKPGAPSHPKHNLKVTVEKAYELFLLNPDYLSWKAENEWDHDVGFTVYKESFKCFCHAPMIAEECACEIHSQMV